MLGCVNVFSQPWHTMIEVNSLTKKREKDFKSQNKAELAAKAFVSKSSFKNDPLGSYTGHPKDEKEIPEQDADDL